MEFADLYPQGPGIIDLKRGMLRAGLGTPDVPVRSLTRNWTRRQILAAAAQVVSVDNLVAGKTSKKNIWEINTEEDYHEKN